MKNILFAVTGLSPQVITETLYAIHQTKRNVDEIQIITTREGKEKIYSQLLAGNNGHYFKYLKEYGFDSKSINFSFENIHVVNDKNGIELADIITESDNKYLLKKCLDISFNLTKNSDNAVFFSVAGGRKTMSSCLTLGAQLYGRPQDRLYHVLVNPEFESNKSFYYPPKKSALIELFDKNGQIFYKETKYAKVQLINIPFISIRNNLSPEYLKEPKDPGTLMLSLIKDDTDHLQINLINSTITYNNIQLDMMPTHLALYSFFASNKKHCTKINTYCSHCSECFIEAHDIHKKQDKISDLYFKIRGKQTNISNSGITKLDLDNFNMYKTKIKKILLNQYGPYALNKIEIASTGKRPSTKYGINLDRDCIEIIY